MLVYFFIGRNPIFPACFVPSYSKPQFVLYELKEASMLHGETTPVLEKEQKTVIHSQAANAVVNLGVGSGLQILMPCFSFVCVLLCCCHF